MQTSIVCYWLVQKEVEEKNEKKILPTEFRTFIEYKYASNRTT